MSDIETLLRQSFASHHDAVTVDEDLLDGAIARGVRRTRRRQLALGVAAASVVVVLVASLAVAVPMRGTDDGDLAAGDASAPWWSMVDIADPSIFSGDGDTIISQIMPWQDQLVVLGAIQPSSGETAAYAWTTDDGVDWERRLLDLPAGCGFSNGAVAVSDRLVIECNLYDTSPDGEGGRIGVASTSDLESWTVTPVSENGQWFGGSVGAGPDGTVVVQALEADDPNTTVGSTMRIWSTSDLQTWTPIEGETTDTMVDGQASSIRTVDDRIVLTGTFNDYRQAGPEAPSSMLPAIWVSTDGAPFVRTLLGSGDGSASPSAAVLDMVSTASGYVAVGTAGTPASGLAWTSPDLVDWSTVTVAAGEPASAAGDSWTPSLWDVETLPDGTLLAAGSRPLSGGPIAEGWLSDDNGANWRTVGVGPDRLAVWNGQAVGMSGGVESQPTFWTWGGDSSPPSSSVDLGAADELEVGEVRWHAEHQLYLVGTDSAVMAFFQHSPHQGCRLMLASDVDFPDPYLRDGAVFADPCHGAMFALDGTHLGGPSPRDLDQYRVELRDGRITVDTTRLLIAP